jgi:hypothetical protein
MLQCQAIAAAVLGDANAFSIDYWGGTVGVNRFVALNEGKFDVIFGSDYTANRDIYFMRYVLVPLHRT